MSGQLDLIPASCRAALGRRTRVRRWIVAYAVAGAGMFGGYMLASAGAPRLESERTRLDNLVKQRWLRNAEVQELVGKINELSGRIARYDRLAWPVRVSDAIASLGAEMPESMTLTSLTLTPRQEATRVTRKPKPGGKGAEESAPKSSLAVELEGLAPDDFALALFVSGVEAHPLFKNVALDYARSRVVDGRESRGFRVTCEIDLSAQYVFSDAAPAGGVE